MIGSKQTVESTENPKLLNEFCMIELSIVSCGNGVWRDVTQEVLWTFLEDKHEPSKVPTLKLNAQLYRSIVDFDRRM